MARKRTNLRGTNLSHADLRDADLRGACLDEADLTGANLRRADLRGASFAGAVLRGADLSDAILDPAAFSRADIEGARVDGTALVALRSEDPIAEDAGPASAARLPEREPADAVGIGPKRLVVCCDGTWERRSEAPTNVAKIFRSVAAGDAVGRAQLVFYNEGVRSLLGGLFGWQAGARQVCEAYAFLVRNFSPGDEIFFFGFSRGAYVARSVVGLIRNCGILRNEHADRIPEAYALYRGRTIDTGPDSVAARTFQQHYSNEARVRFIGVWETVGALGVPLAGLRKLLMLGRRNQFHDVSLLSIVESAFQALAIDERRASYVPALWQVADWNQQLVEQVWFSGAHGDVGGGYAESGLSDITLAWMASRAKAMGLQFDAGAFNSLEPDPHGHVHESQSSWSRLFGSARRTIGVESPTTEYVASSALERLGADAHTPDLRVMETAS
ncbi:phospholipase effector Tle1 domain-containing protein [Amycolatopsis sp. NPDC051758]|uniref:phospholipase effector Tle1 domain-containing protein n=1 Tax=Amycolatopsis sp. NPDC051758 TaxID=3363935 RepID=UPI0037AB1BD5